MISQSNLRENLWLALDTLRTHKFRSILTVLGVFIGTLTVILVSSAVAGLDRQVVQMAQDFGTRTVFVSKIEQGLHRPTPEERMRKPLSYEDAMALKELCPSIEEVAVLVMPGFFEPTLVKYQGLEMVNAFFAGSTPEDFRILNANLRDGRLFTEIDNSHARNVAVVGADVVLRFFENVDPIGKSVLVNGHSYEIVGTLAKRKQALADTGEDRMVFIPYFTFKKVYPEAKDNYIHALAHEGKVAEAVDEVTGVLRRLRGDKPSQPNSFGVGTAESAIEQFRGIMNMIALVAVALASIALLVGGIGVMNIMLVSVTERTREIGVRKAIGAKRRDITWQFLLEAMTLTATGGILGIVVGYLVSFAIRTFVPMLPSNVPTWAVVAGFTVSVSIGLFFGMWPAVKASRLDPIVALRHE